MISFVLLLIWLSVTPTISEANHGGFHMPLFRRAGRFVRHQPANLTDLSSTLSYVEARYSRTFTVARENRIVRQWQHGSNGADEYLLSGIGLDNTWLVLNFKLLDIKRVLTDMQVYDN